MAFSKGVVVVGLLASTTTRGMPFTNSTMSGMIVLSARPAGHARANWLTARKVLFSGWSQSMKDTVWPRP
jgi:hypothetical protein